MNKTTAMLLLALSGFVPALTAAFGAVRLFVTYRSSGLPLWVFSVTLLKRRSKPPNVVVYWFLPPR